MLDELYETLELEREHLRQVDERGQWPAAFVKHARTLHSPADCVALLSEIVQCAEDNYQHRCALLQQLDANDDAAAAADDDTKIAVNVDSDDARKRSDQLVLVRMAWLALGAPLPTDRQYVIAARLALLTSTTT